MILAKETTDWGDVEYRQPNHTYLMSDNMEKIFGYFKFNKSKDFMLFKTPIFFDKRHRKFKVIQKGIKNL